MYSKLFIEILLAFTTFRTFLFVKPICTTKVENIKENNLEGILSGMTRKKSPEAKVENTKRFKNCAVSTEVPMCSDLGVKIMKRGGNAMDAAIASGICVGIINSFSSGLGGGGFLLVRKPSDSGDIMEMIDFRETAPSNITIETLQEKADLTKVQGTSVGVPGEVKGFYLAHKRYGKLEWSQLFEENIRIANGFEASEQLCRRLKKLKKYIFADEGLRNTYTRNGKLIEIGQVVTRKNYAETLKKISKDPESFYRGDIAEKIVETVNRKGGFMSKKDLTSYKAVIREPLVGNYKDYRVFTTNLPTSGVFIIEALNIMEKFDIKEIAEVGNETMEYPHYHLLIEIFKFMAAKRGELADPDFLHGWKSVVNEIISEDYADSIVKKIDFNSILPIEEYGKVVESTEDHGTTHLNVVDEDEMVVSLTSTVNLEFGAKFMDEKTGIIFNDEIDDFYVPHVHNAFDLDKMSKNILEPGKRPFSSAAPVIMMKHDEIISIGAAGGTRIPTSIFSVIFHLALGKNLQQAIMASRIHDQLVPSYTYIEKDLPKEIIQYLKSLGHKITVSSQNSIFTSVQGIRIEKSQDGRKSIEAFSDRRKGGMSSGC